MNCVKFWLGALPLMQPMAIVIRLIKWETQMEKGLPVENYWNEGMFRLCDDTF